MDNQKKSVSNSDVKIFGRSTAEITGVDEILSYDDRTIVLSLCGTRTVIEGEALRVTQLSVHDGRVSAQGRINAIIYEDDIKPQKGFISKLFRG
ncbi:MAG: hypothetical protein IKI97_03645 [Clostridia bacterium]|nr:hypothetical protein [Clostridia bacterium]